MNATEMPQLPVESHNFTGKLHEILSIAREEAVRLRHGWIGTEHFLLAIIHEGEDVAATTLTNLHIDLEEVLKTLERKLAKSESSQVDPADLKYTVRSKTLLELAVKSAHNLDHAYVGTEHLLLAMLEEGEGVAGRVLITLGLTQESATEEILRLLARD